MYLYAALNGQTERLLSLSSGYKHSGQYHVLRSRFPTTDSLLAALENRDGTLPTRYQKVYDSYISEKDRYLRDDNYLSKIHILTLDNLKKNKVSKYRVYTDLGLNPGNVNAYLKHGDVSKVSRETANKILEYVTTPVASLGSSDGGSGGT